MKKELRKYQKKAVANFCEWFTARNDMLATIIMATGLGKTYTAANCITSQYADSKKIKVLWAAHREELIDQAFRELKTCIPDANIQIEMAKNRADSSADIVVGSVQTLARSRKNMNGFEPDLIVIDEYHHYHEKNTQYHGLLERYPKAKVLGLTATPFRFIGGDIPLGVKLIEMDIGVAIAHNYLVPPKAETLKTNTSLAGVKSRAGDFATDELSAAVNNKERNELITNRIVKAVREEGRNGILFAVDVQHAKDMATMLREKGIVTGEVYGETPKDERCELMEKVRNKKIEVLVNNLVCLDDKTEILTRSGWVGFDDITDNHLVANWDNGRVYFEKPQHIVKRKRNPNERMVVVETTKVNLRVTEDHDLLWFKRADTSDVLKNKAKDICNINLCLPVSGFIEPFKFTNEKEPGLKHPDSVRVIKNSYNYRKKLGLSMADSKKLALEEISKTNSLKRKMPHELTNEECQFIGFWLGDGTRTKLKSGGFEYIIHQSMTNNKIVDWLDVLFKKLEYNVVRVIKKIKNPNANDQVKWSFSRGTGFSSQRVNGLYGIENYLNKDGSDLFWGLNKDQLRNLFIGFFMSDGDHKDGSSYIDNNDKTNFSIYNTNYNLISLLQAIACCNGFKTNVRKYNNNRNGSTNKKEIYRLFVKANEDRHRLTKNRLQIESEPWKDEMVWCVKTSSSNIITRRNGSVVVMGNCTEGFDVPHMDFVCIARPTKSLGLFIQMLGRGLRLSLGKNDCLVIDVFDKAKVTQGIITMRKVVSHGDIDGSRRRTDAIMKEEIADKLVNFPVVMRLNKDENWTLDNTTWFSPSWEIDSNQYVITWSKRTQRVKSNNIDWNPIRYIPKKIDLLKGTYEVMHQQHGVGIAVDCVYTGDVCLSVRFSDQVINVPISELKNKGYSYEIQKLDKPIRRAFYIITNDTKSYCRLISLVQEGSEFRVESDLKGDMTTVNEVIRATASEDDVLQIVKSDAPWRKKPASDKQINLISNFISWGKLNSGIDLKTMTGGDASALMDQVDWKPIINSLFGAKEKKELIGYLKEFDDI